MHPKNKHNQILAEKHMHTILQIYSQQNTQS